MCAFRLAGTKRESVVQMIDVPATILSFFKQPLPKDCQGHCLAQTVASDVPVRKGLWTSCVKSLEHFIWLKLLHQTCTHVEMFIEI